MTVGNTKSKKPIVILVSAIVVLSVGVCLIMSAGSTGEVTVTGSDATWVGIPGGITEENAIQESSIIAEGKVISQRTEIRGHQKAAMVFTISTVEIPDIFSMSKADAELVAEDMARDTLKIEIVQTGGASGERVTPPLEETPLMEIGKTYFLILEKTEDGHYLPVGGMFGTGEITSGKVKFVNEDSRELFSDIEGKRISKVTDILTDVVEENDLDSDVYVNKDGHAPADAIQEVRENE